MAAPEGNNNYRQGKMWTAAIRRALQKRSRTDQLEALDDLAEKFLAKCDDGDMQAFKELGDRMEGKVAQGLDLGSDPERPLISKIVREIVRTPNSNG
jgi:hypothetical protein